MTPELDWDIIIKRRLRIIEHNDEVPAYLVLPEVKRLLNHTRNARFHFFLNTLWNTGTRISEALSLTPSSFYFDDEFSYVSIDTLKKRTGPKPKPKVGRPKSSGSKRLVPVTNESYRTAFQMYCDAYKIRPDEPLFNRTRNAYNKRIDAHIERLANQGVVFPVPISPKTFRHSFAINCLLHGIDLKEVSNYLGHANIKETEVYTKITSGETHDRMNQVNF